VAGGLVAAVFAGGVAGLSACGGGTGAASLPAAARLTAADQVALRALLATQAAAVRTHDAGAYLGTIDPASASAAFRADQQRVFGNLAVLPLSRWAPSLVGGDTFDVSDTRRAELGAPAVGVVVRVSYRLAGVDRADVTYTEKLTVVHRSGRWYAAGTADALAPAPPQLWDFGTLAVARGAHALVIGAGTPATLRGYAGLADAAAARASAIWGDGWGGAVVVEVPASEFELAALLGAEPSAYQQVAAVTSGETGLPSGATPADRVLVNPQAFAELTAAGKAVVFGHELTHVATASWTRPWTPRWLAEGAANYTGYLDTTIPRRAVLSELRAAYGHDVTLGTLPTDADFAPGASDGAAWYELAWLGCELIARRYGQQRLVAFYRAVGAAGTAADTADQQARNALADRELRAVLGVSLPAFLTAWRAYASASLAS
jgi:hypothetical protein